MFCLVGLTRDIDVLEQGIKAIINASSEDIYVSFFGAYNSYIIHSENAFERYIKFTEIFGSYSQVEYDFECFKTAVTNLYREECLSEAATANENFQQIKAVYHNSLDSAAKEKLDRIIINFDTFTDNNGESAEELNYEPLTLTLRDPFPYNMSNPEDMMKHTASYIADECERLLYNLLIHKTKDNMRLLSVDHGYGKTTIKEFYSQIDGLRPTLLIGMSKFKWNDPDYEQYKLLVESLRLFHCAGFLIAIDTSQIKLAINNFTITIKKLSDEEVADRIASDKVISVTDGHYISVEEEDARTYLENKYQVIEITFSVAIHCPNNNVGGGFIFDR